MSPRCVQKRVAVVAVLLCAMTAAAQEVSAPSATVSQRQADRRIPRGQRVTTAAMLGMVTTTDGRPVGGALVKFVHAGGKQYAATTTADGIFRVPGLTPGLYVLHISRVGFDPLSGPAVELKSGEMVAVEIQLKVSADAMPAERDRQISTGPGEGVAEPQPSYREVSRRLIETEETQYSDLLGTEQEVFVRRENRWKLQEPEWVRYPGREGEYPYVVGHWWDPFNRNKLKGDYPIFGNHFFNFTGSSTTAMNFRRLYVPSGVSAAGPGREQFFGSGTQQFLSQTFRFTFDLFRGNTAFRPIDWRVRVTPAINVNQIWTRQRGVTNIDVRRGTDRTDYFASLQEAFFEVKLTDLSHKYDFVSLRTGIQQFNSDFRGLIYFNEHPGARLFGNFGGNRFEYNAAYFFFLEKDTNSGLNRFKERHQQVMVANLYVQDFIKKGYTTQVSYHYSKDDASVEFDRNDFLVRPAPIGAVTPHDIRAHYIGWTGNGHLGRYNVNHAFYQVLGYDELNPIAGRRTDISAQMAALELSIDKDWVRPRIAFFYGSGDEDPRDGTATGFDSITEGQTFAGSIFSFFNRESIRLTGTGVALNSPESFLPNLRASKDEGQANFVNPGILLWSAGVDFELTPQLKSLVNVNYMRFHRTAPLELLLFQKPIRHSIGFDYSLGFVYRPPLSDNMVIITGLSALQPGTGLRQIYQSKMLLSSFTVVKFQF